MTAISWVTGADERLLIYRQSPGVTFSPDEVRRSLPPFLFADRYFFRGPSGSAGLPALGEPLRLRRFAGD